MKLLKYILYTWMIVLLTACGEDRTGEFYALIEDRMWIEEVMRENYLWAEDMPVIEKEDDYFQEPATFFKNLLSKNALNGKGDKYSYMEETSWSKEIRYLWKSVWNNKENQEDNDHDEDKSHHQESCKEDR